MTIYSYIKQNITAKDIAEFYKLPKSGKLYSCPFHDDSSPSMLVKDRFFCFGCGATGDVIDLVSRIYKLKPKDAAIKIATDFGFNISSVNTGYNSRDHPDLKPPRKSCIELISKLIEHELILKDIRAFFAPLPEDEQISHAFIVTQRKLEIIDDFFYAYYQSKTNDEKLKLIDNNKILFEEVLNVR